MKKIIHTQALHLPNATVACDSSSTGGLDFGLALTSGMVLCVLQHQFRINDLIQQHVFGYLMVHLLNYSALVTAMIDS